MNTKQIHTVESASKSEPSVDSEYKSPFRMWDKKAWIRTKPLRVEPIIGLPFSPELVPLISHSSLEGRTDLQTKVMAYRLLGHLKFTTLLELEHINPVCSFLARGECVTDLTDEERIDALRVFADEGGHALFCEHFSLNVARTYGIDQSIIGKPQFEGVLHRITEEYSDRVHPRLLQFFFSAISETLVTKVLFGIPQDPRVAQAVRLVIGDHCADEAQHSIFFRGLFGKVWNALDANQQEHVGQLLPKLVWTFLGPDHGLETNILLSFGFTEAEAKGILEEVYPPGDVSGSVREAAWQTISMFKRTGMFDIPSVRQAFADFELLGEIKVINGRTEGEELLWN